MSFDLLIITFLIAFILGLVVGVVLARVLPPFRLRGYTITLFSMSGSNLYDDLRGASARSKFAVEFAVAGALYLCGHRIQ